MSCTGPAFSFRQKAFMLMFLLTATLASVCQADGPPTADDVKQIVWADREFLADPKKFLIEAYAQLSDGNGTVRGDEYHFGRGGDGDWLFFSEFAAAQGATGSSSGGKSALSARGLIQMVVPDGAGLDQHYYDWEYKGEELLGNIRCITFDLKPSKNAGYGSFIGRIWVAIPDRAIVRFDGTYISKGKRASHYFHFVSVRTKNALGEWRPSEVYVEEGSLAKPIRGSSKIQAHMVIWDYQPVRESTLLRIAPGPDLAPVDDSANNRDSIQRYHEIEAEVIRWMETHGLLSPIGNTEKVLETVVNNILATNQDAGYRWPIKVRVLLTEPLESFTVGDTIVVSKGLIDVVPDEAGLALVLSRELAHILLNHHINTRFGYHDFFLKNEQQVLKDLNFQRTPQERADAEAEAVELLVKSPYKQRLSSAALFLRAVAESCETMPALNTKEDFERRESYVKYAGYSLSILAIIVAGIAQLTRKGD